MTSSTCYPRIISNFYTHTSSRPGLLQPVFRAHHGNQFHKAAIPFGTGSRVKLEAKPLSNIQHPQRTLHRRSLLTFASAPQWSPTCGLVPSTLNRWNTCSVSFSDAIWPRFGRQESKRLSKLLHRGSSNVLLRYTRPIRTRYQESCGSSSFSNSATSCQTGCRHQTIPQARESHAFGTN